MTPKRAIRYLQRRLNWLSEKLPTLPENFPKRDWYAAEISALKLAIQSLEKDLKNRLPPVDLSVINNSCETKQN